MKRLILLGATGGLGSQLLPLLRENYDVLGLGSKDVDITNVEQVKNLFIQNPADIVINLSGYNYDSFIHKYNTTNFNEINKQIDINIKGTINIITNCLSYMREQQYGRIILASSILADHPVVSTGVYSGCKGFIDSIVKTVALENVKKDVTCNSLQLGYFDGGLTYKIPEDFREVLRKSIPSQRLGSIIELYNTINFLINTGYITGQNINVSGGII